MKMHFRMICLVLTCLCLYLSIGHSVSADDKKIQEIVSKDGRYFRDIRVVIPHADYLEIITDQGTHKVDFEMLPQSVQKRYKYDPVKAQKVREARKKKEDEIYERSMKSIQLYQKKYRGIKKAGIVSVALKRFTVAPKGGGFYHISELSVLPVLDGKIAMKGEIFDVNPKYFQNINEFLKLQEAEKSRLINEAKTLPDLIKKLEATQLEATEKLNELLNSPKNTVIQKTNEGNIMSQRYDPIVMQQITTLRKQIRSIRKQISGLKKKDPDDYKKQVMTINELIAKVNKNAAPYLDRYLNEKVAETQSQNKQQAEKGQKNTNETFDKEDLKAKLKALKEMYDSKLIDKDDYEKKKQQILSEM